MTKSHNYGSCYDPICKQWCPTSVPGFSPLHRDERKRNLGARLGMASRWIRPYEVNFCFLKSWAHCMPTVQTVFTRERQLCICNSLKKQPRLLGSLSKDVFERRTSTGSEAFSLFIYLDSNKFVLLSFFSLIKMIYSRVSTEPLPNDAKSQLLVEVRRSKTLLLKLPNYTAPPTGSPGNDVWETSAEIPYWWRITTQIWIVLPICCTFALTNQKHYP